jgi:hypothetical protein
MIQETISMIGTVVVSGAATAIALFGPVMFVTGGDQREESRQATVAVGSVRRQLLPPLAALVSDLAAGLRAALMAAARASARPSLGLARQTGGAD